MDLYFMKLVSILTDGPTHGPTLPIQITQPYQNCHLSLTPSQLDTRMMFGLRKFHHRLQETTMSKNSSIQEREDHDIILTPTVCDIE
mmetsp:Transcript_20284/g.42565  ORF Transcript_20284/g.42565 Transcript_20284/m.42565 type:complete len:87 (-) Transcript_20284:303-563(-)